MEYPVDRPSCVFCLIQGNVCILVKFFEIHSVVWIENNTQAAGDFRLSGIFPLKQVTECLDSGSHL